MVLKVKFISEDDWGRPRLQNTVNKRIYADISCGNLGHTPEYRLNIHGDWCTTSSDGEPECPLRPEVEFDLVARDGFTLTILHLPYTVTPVAKGFLMPNPFGTTGIESLRRSNPWNETTGLMRDITVGYIEGDEAGSIEIETFNPRVLVNVIKGITNAFSSVGWECLEPMPKDR